MAADPSAATAPRCTYRKHVIENGAQLCDCATVIVGPTAAGNAQVVTLLHHEMAVKHTDEADVATRGSDGIGI